MNVTRRQKVVFAIRAFAFYLNPQCMRWAYGWDGWFRRIRNLYLDLLDGY